ncbi:MAG TPA: tol-pal system protein YbgF [Gemmatimonadaceae bacterium]|nr:tol-pal system protein YbgF [Gemmatimonadaceae bacterium]
MTTAAFRPALGLGLGVTLLSGCFATRNDVRVLQQDLRTARAEAMRADSARARQIDAVARIIGVLSDSVRLLQANLARVQGDMRGDFRQVNQQLLQIQELAGQSTRRLQDIRAEMEQRNQQQQQPVVPPPVTGDTTTPVAPATPPAPGPAQLLSLGRQQYAQRSYSTARAAFEELLRTHPESDLAPDAQLYIGECWAAEGNAAAADAAYNTVVTKYPQSAKAPNALYKLALSQAKQGKRAEARLFMERVRRDYPQSEEAELADAWLKSNR